MFSWWQWSETSPSAASSIASSHQVTGSTGAETGAALGVLSAAMVDEFEILSVVGEFAGNTNGTLDVFVQTFVAGHWYDFCHIKQQGAGASMVRNQYVAGRATQVTGTLIGIDSSPALANDTIVGGVWGESFRLWIVSGAGTTVGTAVKVTLAAQVMRNAKR